MAQNFLKGFGCTFQSNRIKNNFLTEDFFCFMMIGFEYGAILKLGNMIDFGIYKYRYTIFFRTFYCTLNHLFRQNPLIVILQYNTFNILTINKIRNLIQKKFLCECI